jgi:ABC-type proline/glycine betaine transport system permease subunit
MELRFFGLRLYVIVQKTIANLGAAAIIGGVGIAVFDLVDRTREFKYLWMLIPGTLLGILFHIVCGAVPDLLRVLMRIEAHVRRGGPLR